MQHPAIQADLLEIARRARFLHELVDSPAATDAPAEATWSAASKLLERWAFAFSKGDPDAFERRLGWDRLTLEDVTRRLRGRLGHAPENPPDWIQPLADVLERYTETGRSVCGGSDPVDLPPWTDGQIPPFAELWLPFVLWARQRVVDHRADIDSVLTIDARHDLERVLTARLARVSERVVYDRFSAFRSAAAKLTSTAHGTDPPARPIYLAFLGWMFDGGMIGLLKEFSALARQVCRLTDSWASSTQLLIERLQGDRPEIEARFGDGRPIGRVARIGAGPADLHHGGQQVLDLAFESGLRLMYKPRDIGLEAAFNSFLLWLAEAGLGPAPPAVRTLPRAGYGWAEFIPQTPAADLEAASDYYRRAGALLCVAWLVHATDLHMENVIAGPSGPVVVDAETMVQPRVRSHLEEPSSLAGEDGDSSLGTILDTGLLTFLEVGPRGGIYDSGGFCGYGGHLEDENRRQWIHTNTDAMSPLLGAAHAHPQQNLLVCDGGLQRTEHFTSDLISGFAATYRFLAEHRSELGASDGPLRWLQSSSTRFIFRPSNLYATIICHLQTPKYQRTGWSQGILIDSMNRVFRDHRQRPRSWPLVHAERLSLERLDIPHFTVPADARDLDPGTAEVIADHFDRAGIELVRDRVDALDERDLERQIEVLERILWTPGTAAETTERGAGARDSEAAGTNGRPEVPHPERDPAVCAAEWIADQIRQTATVYDDGSQGWSGGDPDAPLARWYLYDGDLGVALFLGALARITGADRYRDAALSATAGIGTLLQGDAVSCAGTATAIGACNGLGGLIYPLARLGRLLDEGILIDWALQIADTITAERIAADQRYDVEGGAAGAIVALLALHRTTGERWLIDRAAGCGDHLVARSRTAPTGGVGWPNQDGVMLAGFAHGAAGIAYALTLLYENTDGMAFRETAQAALRYERTLFDATEGNWPVLVSTGVSGEDDRIFMSTWCHGAPGIALGRLGLLKTLGDDEVRREIDTALDATLRIGVGQVDHLCCGNMGRVEALLTAGQLFKNVGHMRAAGIRSVMVLQRAYDRGSFGLYPPGTAGPPLVPGFFRGLAGIGYQLLRQSHPDQLPSVALFEPDAEPSCQGGNR